jgi:hypothetical protein
MLKSRALLSVTILMLLAAASGNVRAEPYESYSKPDWDRPANIKDAAKRLALLHRREGSTGVLKFLDACYRTHILSPKFSQGLEACMAQDYMHTQVLALIYGRLPDEQRKQNNMPSPQQMADAMGQRFVMAFSQYKVPTTDASGLKTLVDKNGMQIFMASVFPKAAPSDGQNSERGK